VLQKLNGNLHTNINKLGKDKHNMNNQKIRELIGNATTAQKELLKLACNMPIEGGSEEILKSLDSIQDTSGVGGVLGTLRRHKIDNMPLIIVIGRNEKGNKVYGINEMLIKRAELKALIEELENY